MDKINLIKILEGDISLLDLVNVDDIALYETRVRVTPQHVRKMLLDFLAGNLTAEYLTRWASFICIRSEYSCDDYIDDKMSDYYEDMFYVLQCLSTPAIDGEVNEKQVRLYLTLLDKYF